jgi:two-component system, OmpR family, response regulator
MNDRTEMRILLVEDSEILRSRLIELLTDPGVMRVNATAETEQEAHEQIAAHDFDALVIDIHLKQGSGFGVIRDARKHWTTPPLPLVIVLTNHTLPAVQQRCFAMGADYFLDKSRQFNQVALLIRQRHG